MIRCVIPYGRWCFVTLRCISHKKLYCLTILTTLGTTLSSSIQIQEIWLGQKINKIAKISIYNNEKEIQLWTKFRWKLQTQTKFSTKLWFETDKKNDILDEIFHASINQMLAQFTQLVQTLKSTNTSIKTLTHSPFNSRTKLEQKLEFLMKL